MDDLAVSPLSLLDASDGSMAEGDLACLLDAPHPGLDLLPVAVLACDEAGRIRWLNRRGCRPKLGRSQSCGPWRLHWPDERPMRHDESPMAIAIKEGRPIRGAEALLERPDGTLVAFAAYPTPLHDESGVPAGAVNVLVDLSERATAEARQKALLDELNHRVKNTLATVRSLAAQTFREASIPKRARQAFDGRLLALSKTHDHLARGGWKSANLRSILHDIFSSYSDGDDRRVRLVGPPITLAPRQAIILAMAFHELATNAATHGSLSALEGGLAVTWSVSAEDGRRHLEVAWQESGGPHVQPPPQHRGFGSRLVERSLIAELKGKTVTSFEPSGVRCSISIPLSAKAA